MTTRTPTRAASPVADLSEEVKWYLRARGYKLPAWCIPALRTPEPVDVPGAMFDPERVDRVIGALKLQRHTQGKWRGRPLEPAPWQVAYLLAPVFGWVAPNMDGEMVRIIRNCYCDLPRKNGKTTLGAGLALYLAFGDREPGAQVIAVAASKDQARKCFDPAAQIAKRSPQLQAAGVRPLQSRIVRDSDGSVFEVVSSLGDLLHGANVHGAVIDELHVHKSAGVLDAVESGTGAREQPLIIIITTPDEGKPNTVYASKRQYVEQLASRVIKNPRQYGVVFAAAESDNPHTPATWRKANPGFGVAPTRESLEDESNRARQSPVNFARFQRLHLGIRTRQATRYIMLDEWDRNAGIVREDQLNGRIAYGGLDLGSTSDLTSVCWIFPDVNGGHDVLWRFWAPEDKIAELDKRTAHSASVWRRQGLLKATSGNVTDYEVVRSQIVADLARFRAVELAYDPWNATDLVNRLTAESAPMVQVRQGYASLSPPLKEVKRLLAEGTAETPMLRHGGNPIARWMIDNLAVAMDPSGNVKPDKAVAADKIDGVSALVTAMARAMHHQPPAISAYESSDLEIL